MEKRDKWKREAKKTHSYGFCAKGITNKTRKEKRREEDVHA